MQGSSNQPPSTSSGRPVSHEGTCPLLQVVSASENGVVVESQRDFEVGSSLTLGFHVTGLSEIRQRDSSFISADTVVVESLPVVNEAGRLVFRVSLLFADISREDRRLLLRISEDEQIPEAAGNGNGSGGVLQFGLN